MVDTGRVIEVGDTTAPAAEYRVFILMWIVI